MRRDVDGVEKDILELSVAIAAEDSDGILYVARINGVSSLQEVVKLAEDLAREGLVGMWARVMLVPRPLLFGGILVLASIGGYSLNRSLLDLALLYVVGVVGCVMRIYDFPLVPAVLGLVLGPLAELQFRRAAAISEGDLTVFFTRPISAVLLAVALALLAGPSIVGRRFFAASRGED